MDILKKAIDAVKKNELNFFKFLRPNEVGATGSHQSGILVSKSANKIMFEGESPKIKTERTAEILWQNGKKTQNHFKYYDSKNEFRITNFGKNFEYLNPTRVGTLFILSMTDYDNYQGYFLSDKDEIEQFLSEFDLKKNNDNILIPKNSLFINKNEIKPVQTELNYDDDINDESEKKFINFKPKAHILILLGEELIKSPVMAIYELIKNSYDADAKQVDVNFEDIEDLENAKITIIDNGTGITKEVIENVWFEPGTDFRKPVVNGIRQIKRSPLYYRIPMGEKGVGRFAVHKLGHKIKLISRPAEVTFVNNKPSTKLLDYEIIVEIDWRKFLQSKYLEDVEIEWYVNKQKNSFKFKNTSGTYIEVSDLKETWARGMARQLKRNTISMLSPRNDREQFNINLNFNNWWLNDFPDIDEILNQSPYKLSVSIDQQYNMSFYYEFDLKNNPEIGNREVSNESSDLIDRQKHLRNIKFELRPFFRSYLETKEYTKERIDHLINEFDSENNLSPFGNVSIELNSFDLDSNSLRDYTYSPSLVKSILKEHAGIKVFKGDLRVYDYGEPGNDWLGLDYKRVNNKSWFSNNQNIGFIYLDPENSNGLIEKTNREGFIENETYDYFIVLLEFILNEFRTERYSDRLKWLRFNKKGNSNSFESQLNNFKELITDTDLSDDDKKTKLLDEANKIEERYVNDRDILLIPAGVGMTASFAMHEIEKLVPRLNETAHSNPIDQLMLINQVDELKDYTEGILSVLKKGTKRNISLIESINQAINNYSLRLKSRNIEILINHDESIDTIYCDKRILITILMNLIDNSIYWLDTVYRKNKNIYISTLKNENSISIIFVDNGPGFKDKVQDIVSPFFSRKEGGIGIGLYLVDTVMMQYGKLEIITDNEVLLNHNIPIELNGAAVELIFKN